MRLKKLERLTLVSTIGKKQVNVKPEKECKIKRMACNLCPFKQYFSHSYPKVQKGVLFAKRNQFSRKAPNFHEKTLLIINIWNADIFLNGMAINVLRNVYQIFFT